MEIIEYGKSKRLHKAFPEHQHGYWEVLFNAQGSGILSIGGENYPFSPGTVAVIPPYTPHRKESAEGFSDRSLFLRTFRNIGGRGVRVIQDDAQGTVAKIFDMAEQFYDANERSENKVEIAILDVLGDLLYHVLVSFYLNSKKRDLRLEHILEVMQENVANPDFDLSQAIGDSGYSMGYFRKIFKEMTGQSPVAYFTSLRIARAKSLFRQYGRSRAIKDIAYQCGFQDPLYFSRVFKKYEGVSPQQYIAAMVFEPTPEDIEMILMDTPEELR